MRSLDSAVAATPPASPVGTASRHSGGSSHQARTDTHREAAGTEGSLRAVKAASQAHPVSPAEKSCPTKPHNGREPATRPPRARDRNSLPQFPPGQRWEITVLTCPHVPAGAPQASARRGPEHTGTPGAAPRANLTLSHWSAGPWFPSPGLRVYIPTDQKTRGRSDIQGPPEHARHPSPQSRALTLPGPEQGR